jgi:hypothetical protein
MKLTRAQAGICLIAVLIMSSCSKQETTPTGNIPGVARKVQFTLYTDQDFSNYPKHITFHVVNKEQRQ